MTRTPAGKDALTNARLPAQRRNILELHEALGAPEIPYIEPLRIDQGWPERVNVRGGANAWGQPLGGSGARRPLAQIPMMMLELEQASDPRSRIAGGGDPGGFADGAGVIRRGINHRGVASTSRGVARRSLIVERM
jgi:acetyl-CoA acetyltransferase